LSFIYPILIIIGGILVLYIYIYIYKTRPASKEILSSSNKTHRGRKTKNDITEKSRTNGEINEGIQEV